MSIPETPWSPTQASTSSPSHSLEIPSLLPLSHTHPLLAAATPAEWNVDDFLLSRLNIPLDELRGELRGYLTRLRGELGELINDDYEEFIGMGMGLRGEGSRLEGLEEPLRSVRQEVEQIRLSLLTSQSSLQNLLTTRSSLRTEKQLLSLLLHLSESLGRVESLLRIANTENDDEPEHANGNGELLGSPEDEDNGGRKGKFTSRNGRGRQSSQGDGMGSGQQGKEQDPKMISRIANEYTQLVYLIEQAKMEECDFVEGIEGRMTKIKHTLHHDLSDLFRSTLTSLSTLPHSSSSAKETQRLTAQLGEVLKVYALVEGWEEAEEVVRGMIRPRIEEIVSLQALTLPQEPAVPQTPFTPGLRPPQTPSSITPGTPTVAPPTPISATPSSSNIFDRTLTPQAASSSLSSRRLLDEDNNPLARMYNKLLGLVERDWRPLLVVAEKVAPAAELEEEGAGEGEGEMVAPEGGKKRRFGFLEEVIWKEIGETVMNEIGGVVFAAGRSADLHKNYTTTHLFLQHLESFSPSLPPVQALRKGETYEAFEKRWQLPVYFQLRWKEVVGGLEDVLQSGSMAGGLSQQPFQLPQTAATLHALKQCWAPGIHLPELSHRFWRLFLQILSRYKGWLDKSVGAMLDVGKGQQQKPSASGTSTPAQAATGDPSTDPAALASEETLLRTASVVATDLRLLEGKVRAMWDQDVWAIVGKGMGIEGKKAMDAALEKALASLKALFKPASTQIVNILTRRCTDVLKLVRSVASQFRATPPPAPGAPEKVAASHFVAAILKPLKDYFGKGGVGEGLKAEFGEEWSRVVFDEVVSGYTSILITVRKTEDLVRRVRKGKKSTFSLFSSSSAQSGMSAEEEDERFKKQMLTDVETLGNEAKDLGLDPVAATAGGKEGGWQGLLEVAAGDSSRTTA